jgi:tRNA threonylcarbamoyladenosine biosynthesis protein TsaB
MFENILAIDTSTSHLKLALSFGPDRLVKSDEDVGRFHGRMLIRKISNLFSSAGADVKNLDGIVVSTGPGSFTGLRISLALGKGMAVALGVPLIGVSLFEIAAENLKNEPLPVKVVIQVRRDELLIGEVHGGKFDTKSVQAVPLSRLKEHLTGGSSIGIGVDLFSLQTDFEMLHDSGILDIDPGVLLQIGRNKLIDGELSELSHLEPLYLQKSQAEINFELRHGKL